jgi:DNA-binding NarL/FixJ family response regulator
MAELTPQRSARAIHVDDHPLFCMGLQAALRTASDLEFLPEASTPTVALELARHTPIDVALVDVVMPSLDGVAFTAALHALQPECKILGLSMIDEPVRIAEMLRAGAVGYALKTEPATEILQAIRLVLAGIQYLSPSISHAEVARVGRDDQHSLFRLTSREREVFEWLIRGQSNDDIASALFISRRTVETHRQRILKKLDVHSVVELVHIATRYGIS